jgi:epoxyqueuosine reductase
MSSHDTAQQLKEWAIQAGFHRAGVATLEPSRHGEHLRRWLDRGEHAAMAWIAKRTEIREDPARLLPGARSVLCVALQYHPLTGQEEPTGDLWPRVARYARGRDYHDVMGERLKVLEKRIRDAFPEAGTRRYVDTGPILERELAARAGLGTAGKNTMLLDRRWGSYFLLGELLLTLELDGVSDELASDLCGHCTRCLDACPTGALYEPYRLDANRCISYWTIEHRGALPPAAREMVGEWVFGCDVCQEVCPYNWPAAEKRPPVEEPPMRLPHLRQELDLVALLRLDREEYVERFRGSPMKRAKLDGLKRNAAVAMGHRGRAGQDYVPALAEALRLAEPVVRRHAAWALGRIATGKAQALLRLALASETEAEVRQEIEAGLASAAAATATESG